MTARTLTRRVLLGAVLVCALLAVGAAATGLWLRGRIAASLPTLDGRAPLPGLSAPVRVTRDALGIPTVEGATRVDVARATGWLHAQDRFFQMDLLRRRGAGELSELIGKATLSMDHDARVHGFRRLARQVIARESPARQALLEAYADGVNAGLAALRAPPWEYAVLRAAPQPWEPEDSILVSFAMTLDLQDPRARHIRTLATLRDTLGRASLAFFAPLMTAADAALDGTFAVPPPVPPASEIDLRAQTHGGAAGLAGAEAPAWRDGESPGSNSFAVSGALGAGGGAVLANDMHLHLGLPNVWYRMSLRWPGHAETGATLPGAPTLVVGSTGRIAWGFTNSYAGTADVLIVDHGPAPELYHGPAGGRLLQFEVRKETVAVAHAAPVTIESKWTIWGPVLGEDAEGHALVLHWTEDDPAATNGDIADLEEAPDARAAVEIAHHMGIPAQNFLVADASGQIAWTVAGLLPNRVGYDGRLPVKWSFGDRRWDGYVPPAQVPALVAPPGGRLWTANNRTVGGRDLAALGDGGYADPARAHQIRDDLGALADAGRPVGPKDLLAVQLDDRAVLLEGWHALLLETLTPEAVAAKPSRAALLGSAGKWEGRADASSVSYGIVRDFRWAVARRVLNPIFAPCVEQDPDFSWSRLDWEQPLRTILKERPVRLLDPSYASWGALLVAAADDVSQSLAKSGAGPGGAPWGVRVTTGIEHPFARFLPHWASAWLRMPEEPLAGDTGMPRVQYPDFGASERFAVSPGRESEGIFEMPGGEAANPLSPYFRAGHEAWAHGDPSPFLPGPAEHTLELVP